MKSRASLIQEKIKKYIPLTRQKENIQELWANIL
jgi:hypothetical protein